MKSEEILLGDIVIFLEEETGDLIDGNVVDVAQLHDDSEARVAEYIVLRNGDYHYVLDIMVISSSKPNLSALVSKLTAL